MREVLFWVLAIPALGVAGTSLGLWWHVFQEGRRQGR